MYRIEIWSDFAELYRYNLFITSVGYDSQGEQIYVEGCEKIHCTEFTSGLKAQQIPSGFVVGESFSLEVREAEALQLIVDVVTNTLPADARIENSPPFEIDLKVSHKTKVIHTSKHRVNQWGGANIIVKI